MIESPIRLRRAIHLKDALLVKRIVQSNPQLLKNPDYEDKSNSSLHLAAELGLVEIAQVLLDAGHDDTEISRNTDWVTPLMLAAEHGHIEVCAVHSLDGQKRDGRAFPASVDHQDYEGNTPLHHASAAGSLKALRILLEAGADPSGRNAGKWTPIAYSLTVQAEVYFKQLTSEFEAAKRASGPATPSGAPNTLTRTLTNESEAFPPAGFGSPTAAPPLHAGRDRGDSRDSAASQPLPQIPPMLNHQSSRTELFKRKGGGVRLVNPADDAPEARPSTADAAAWSPRMERKPVPTNSGAATGRQGHFDPGRLRAGSADVVPGVRPGSLS
ncbi:hypothetical protein ANO11243_036090 [Dothideomycetidae sp. 11243]|nr:hypothetical protein ANO11243_036090 [fungal sp. No.11243]